jgi:molybdopterin molybdotransferase
MLELVDFDDARRAIVVACAPLDCCDVTLGAAIGLTLRETLHAREDLVPYARSAMDGFAIRAIDARPGAVLPIGARAYAGTGERIAHQPRTATAVATGAPIPDGADAVVPFERIGRRDDAIVIREATAAGDHVFPAGDDARAGEVLVRAGDRLAAGSLALLAGAGYTHVPCTRAARVTILTTGEELVEIAQTPGFGQIRNSNATLVAASLAAHRVELVANHHVRDNRASLRDALLRAANESDLILTTGGASVGERDFIKPVLDELGATFTFRSVALRPARPTAFATLGRARILALPGNPAAAFVGLHAFGIPALRALAGENDPLPRRVRARLRGSLHGKPARTYLAFVRLAIDDEGRLEAWPLDNQCSSLTRTAAGGAGFAVVGPSTGDLHDRDLTEVDVFAWDAIGAARTATITP